MAKIKKKTEVEMLEEDARKGSVAALYNLGYIYLLGEKVEANPQKAISYFRRGASHQDGKCMQALAMCFRNGDGVEVDLDKMIYWLNNGVKINDGSCMYQLGLCYENGNGVEVDMEKAVSLMRMASKQHKEAKRWLKAHHYYQNFFKRIFGGKV